MEREERAIVAPAARVMLVAMLFSLARGEPTDERAADTEGPVDEPLFRRLAALSLAELERLAETGALRVIVSCGRDELSWSLRASVRRHAEQALLEYFVRHGAPRTLLRALFTVSRARIDAVRKSLRVGPRPAARSCRARASAKRSWPPGESSRAAGIGAPAITLSTACFRATRSRRSIWCSARCRPNARSQVVALETGRRPSRFPRRKPGGRRRPHPCAVPSCTVVSPSERWQPSRPLSSDVRTPACGHRIYAECGANRRNWRDVTAGFDASERRRLSRLQAADPRTHEHEP